MTISFNGWTLILAQDSLEEGVHVETAEWSGWGTVSFARKQQPYGTYRTWILQGYEPGTVVYTNSVVGSLSRFAGSLNAGSFVVAEGNWASGTWQAYIRDFTWHYETRERFYSLTLQQQQL